MQRVAPPSLPFGKAWISRLLHFSFSLCGGLGKHLYYIPQLCYCGSQQSHSQLEREGLAKLFLTQHDTKLDTAIVVGLVHVLYLDFLARLEGSYKKYELRIIIQKKKIFSMKIFLIAEIFPSMSAVIKKEILKVPTTLQAYCLSSTFTILLYGSSFTAGTALVLMAT